MLNPAYGLLCSVLAWSLWRHDLSAPRPEAALGLLALGLLLSLGWRRPSETPAAWSVSKLQVAGFAFCLCALGMVIPGKLQSAFVILSLPAIATVVLDRWPTARAFVSGALVLSVVALLQAPVALLLERLAMQHWEFPRLASLFASLFDSVFAKSHSNEALLVVANGRRDHEVIVNWEALSLTPVLLFGLTTLGWAWVERWSGAAVRGAAARSGRVRCGSLHGGHHGLRRRGRPPSVHRSGSGAAVAGSPGPHRGSYRPIAGVRG